MFHLDMKAPSGITFYYSDEPATPETFVANVQQILLEDDELIKNVNKRAVIETMSELSRELRR